jgi:hypothetical protein
VRVEQAQVEGSDVKVGVSQHNEHGAVHDRVEKVRVQGALRLVRVCDKKDRHTSVSTSEKMIGG